MYCCSCRRWRSGARTDAGDATPTLSNNTAANIELYSAKNKVLLRVVHLSLSNAVAHFLVFLSVFFLVCIQCEPRLGPDGRFTLLKSASNTFSRNALNDRIEFPSFSVMWILLIPRSFCSYISTIQYPLSVRLAICSFCMFQVAFEADCTFRDIKR